LTFPYYPADSTATQEGLLNGVDNPYFLDITSTDGGTPASLIVSWEILASNGTTVLMSGDMENFVFWDENNNIPSGSSGSVFSSADYVPSSGTTGVGMSTGSWLGTYDATPTWTGTVVITGLPEIPIPGAIWLLGSGMIGLVGLRRKFRR
jgi:hypothetical protein